MKGYIFMALILWMLFSLILTLSVIGNLVWVRQDSNMPTYYGIEGRSTWAKIGNELVKKLVE